MGNRDNVLTRNEAIDLFRLLVLIEQNLEYQGMNSKWQNMYATDLTLSHALYYSASNLLEKTNKSQGGLIILDEDGVERGSIGEHKSYNVTILLTILLKEIILSINEVVNFRGELFYKGRLEISAPLLGDTVALKSRLGAMIFD